MSDGDTSPDRDADGRVPDVLLHVPDLHVGKIEFELDDLEAHVSLNARVLDLVHLQVGADVRLGHVGLTIEDIGVEALLKVRLDAVREIVAELMGLLKEQPQILTELTKGIGQGVEKLGEGAGEGVRELGSGTGKGVEKVGEGAGEGVKGAGEGVGKGVEGLTRDQSQKGDQDDRSNRQGERRRRGGDGQRERRYERR